MNQLLKATPLATQLPSVPPSSNRHFIKTTGLVLAVAALLAVLWMPAAPGLPPAGQVMLAVLAFAVIVWMTEALDYAVSAVVVGALMIFLLAATPDVAKPESGDIGTGAALSLTIRKQLDAIGKTTTREWKLLAIVLVLLGFWATEKVLHDFDTSSTTIAAIALMLLPRLGVMDWKESQHGFPWGTVVLFAVGISVGTALLRTNAAGWLANLIVQNLGLQHASAFVVLMLLSLFLIVIHLGFASATALASTMIPIIMSVLLAVQTPAINVIGMTMLLQFVVSFGFILPVNAPQNMIAYGTGTFDARDFVRTGFVITLVAMALLVVFALTYWPWMGYMTKTA